MRKNKRVSYTVLILCALILTGFLLRSYHISYPPIGYHSMKEIHYLSVAKGYLDHGDFLHKRILYSGMSRGEGYMEAFPQFPLLPLIYYAAWSFFGVHIWVARFVVILFSLGSVILSWQVARELEADGDTAILTAFFMTVMPLSVFFGRNIQPDSAALFFLLLSTLSFLKWISSFKGAHLAVFSLSFFMIALVKGTFLFLILPLLFLFPFKSVLKTGEWKKILKQGIWPVAAGTGVIVWLVITRMALVHSNDLFPVDRFFLSQSVSVGYWKALMPTVWKHIGENYTYIYFSFSVVGLLWSVMNAGTKLARYILGVLGSSVLYFILISDFATRHSYYHMPFILAISLAAAVGIVEAVSVTDLLKKKYFKKIAMVILIVVALPSVRAGFYKHFDRLMLGSDIAGEYIREHGYEYDRVFISYASPSDKRYDAYRTQLYGTLWSAGKRGSLLPNDYKKIISSESERDFRWILMYNLPWIDRDQSVMDYIQSNYCIKQIGYKGNESKPLYYLLRRGGVYDPSDLEDRSMRKAGTYKFSFGAIDINVKEI